MSHADVSEHHESRVVGHVGPFEIVWTREEVAGVLYRVRFKGQYLERALLASQTEAEWYARGMACEREMRAERNTAWIERRRCLECGELVNDSYMVHDEIWRTVAPNRGGHLHLECVEKRLGRKLEIGDFTPAPINHAIRFGWTR